MAYNKQIALTSNILAIQTAIQLRREHRKPSDYEKKLLQAYTGFGGLKCVLDTNPVEQWPKSEQHLYAFVQQLWQLLDKGGFLSRGGEGLGRWREELGADRFLYG